MSEYKNPRPSATTSAASPDALYDNAVTFRKLLNEYENQTTYEGRDLISWQKAIERFGFGVAQFDFVTGGTLDSKNQLIRNSDELLYRYIGAGTFPLVVAPATNPVGNPDWEAFTATSLQALTGLDSPSVLDGLYRRERTLAQVQSESYSAGDRLIITDRGNHPFNIEAGVVSGPANVLTANGNTAVLQKDERTNCTAYGCVTDRATDNYTNLQAAFSDVDDGGYLTVPGDMLFNGAIVLTANRATIKFSGGEILVGDTGQSATLVSTATGKVGFHFKSCADLTIEGVPNLIGQGTIAVTTLAGMVFDNCPRVNAPLGMRFSTMAAGRFIIDCDDSEFGDANGYAMDGKQTFDNPIINAGSVEVCVGNKNMKSGHIVSIEGVKPARYMSTDGTAGNDNEDCVCGASVIKAKAGELTAHPLALRSAIGCSFGPVISDGASFGVFIQSSLGDLAVINNNHIEFIGGVYPSTGASSDAALFQGAAGPQVGRTTVGSIDAQCDGEFGVYVGSGSVSIGSATLSGAATRKVVVQGDSGQPTSRLHINHLKLQDWTNSGQSQVNFGNGGYFSCDLLEILNGPSTATTAAVRYDSAFGTGVERGYSIGRIKYEKNGSAADFSYLFMNLSDGFQKGYLGDIDNEEVATVQARFGTDSFQVAGGSLYSTQPPTTMAYTKPETIYNNNPSSGGFIGWTLTTSGTPGTWKTFGAISE